MQILNKIILHKSTKNYYEQYIETSHINKSKNKRKKIKNYQKQSCSTTSSTREFSVRTKSGRSGQYSVKNG